MSTDPVRWSAQGAFKRQRDTHGHTQGPQRVRGRYSIRAVDITDAKSAARGSRGCAQDRQGIGDGGRRAGGHRTPAVSAVGAVMAFNDGSRRENVSC